MSYIYNIKQKAENLFSSVKVIYKYLAIEHFQEFDKIPVGKMQLTSRLVDYSGCLVC